MSRTPDPSTTTLPPKLDAIRRRWRLSAWIGIGVLTIVGALTVSMVERAVRESVQNSLVTILDADTTAVRMWLETQRTAARAWASLPEIRNDVLTLAAASRAASREELLDSEAAVRLREALGTVCEVCGHDGYAVVGPSGRVLGSESDERVGRIAPATVVSRIQPAFEGEAVVTLPFELEGRPLMLSAAPVYDDSGEVAAVLGFRLRPEGEFTRILSVARFGDSGDTYAFDANARMLSESRFTPILAQAGMLDGGTEARSSLAVEIRNPGGNLLEGFETRDAPRARPLTRMAADAIRGRSGVDVHGYLDYRGVMVIGAWTWLEEYSLGIATEVSRAEAFRPVRVLRIAFAIVFALLLAAALAGLVSSQVILKLRSRLDRGERLGRYTLERKIGEGGMGEVHLASHEMMRRPTAVKLLRPERASDHDIVRFEREVQLTARLTHPSTIAIYDFGRTPEGVFYYAMEYLPGFTLHALVDRFGPQPEGRVLHILRQLCGSLAEAHRAGLVHRDIKPSNVMLCERGGIQDVVKVLDFGLARRYRTRPTDPDATDGGTVAGTPLYMAPEAFKEPDTASPRSDLYAVGALAYKLLTGHAPFSADNVFALYELHQHQVPQRPSILRGQPICESLENLVMSCLAKDPAKRPADAGAVMEWLDHCSAAGTWTEELARQWWQAHAEKLLPPPEEAPPTGTRVSAAQGGVRDGEKAKSNQVVTVLLDRDTPD